MYWSSLHIVCIVDGETHPGKQFGISPQRVQEVAEACVKYSGSVNFVKMLATVEIIEVSSVTPPDLDLARLQYYRRASIFSKGLVLASRVDTLTRQVWNNSRSRRTTAQRALRAAPIKEAELQETLVDRSMTMQRRKPFVTWAILAVLAAVFALEVVFAGGDTPSVVTLITLGGINQQLVFAGEWWRGAAATVLHADFNHLFLNGIALLIAGSILENMIGRVWFGATYVVAAFAGALASILLGSTFLVSVGASGAIMGVAAAAAICGLVRRRREFGVEAVRLLAGVLIPTLGLAVWGGAAAAHVDHFAHFGGAIGGTVIAGAILAIWKKGESFPGARPVAVGLIGFGCLVLALAAVEVVLHRHADAVVLMPNDAMPRDPAQRAYRVPQLVAQYPDDPRTHFSLGFLLWQQGKLADAETSLRHALERDRTLRLYFQPSLAFQIRGTLAALLIAENKTDEAKTVAKPLCDLPANSPLVDQRMKTIWRTACP